MTEIAVTEVTLSPEAAQELKKRWGFILAFGILTSLVGLLVIIRPWTGVFALAVLIAVGFLLSGVADLARAGSWDNKAIPIIWGLLSIAAGIVAVVWPAITLWALAVVIGLGLMLRGLFHVGAAVTTKPYLWGLWAAFGALEVVVGVLAIAWPRATILVLAVLIGIDLLIAGIVEIVAAVRFRNLQA